MFPDDVPHSSETIATPDHNPSTSGLLPVIQRYSQLCWFLRSDFSTPSSAHQS